MTDDQPLALICAFAGLMGELSSIKHQSKTWDSANQREALTSMRRLSKRFSTMLETLGNAVDLNIAASDVMLALEDFFQENKNEPERERLAHEKACAKHGFPFWDDRI